MVDGPFPENVLGDALADNAPAPINEILHEETFFDNYDGEAQDPLEIKTEEGEIYNTNIASNDIDTIEEYNMEKFDDGKEMYLESDASFKPKVEVFS